MSEEVEINITENPSIGHNGEVIVQEGTGVESATSGIANILIDDKLAPRIDGNTETLNVQNDEIEISTNGDASPEANGDKIQVEDTSDNEDSEIVDQSSIIITDENHVNGFTNQLNPDRETNDESSIAESRLGNNTGHLNVAETHSRTMSTFSIGSNGSMNTNTVFLKTALDQIYESREAKKNIPLQNSCKKALDALRISELPDSSVIFEPLKLACLTHSVELKVAALDCLSKLFTFSIFSQQPEKPIHVPNSIVTPPPKVSLIDAAIESICNCFDGEGTDPKVELQVVRALMACILNMSAHGSSLLTAVRQIYNVFIFSLSPINQGIAQASLTQVINTVFERVAKVQSQKKSVLKTSSSNIVNEKSESNEEQDVGLSTQPTEKLTLQNLENISESDEARAVEANIGDEDDLVVKDVFLIFRAMCKLSVKSLESDSLDMRSHSVRSKLLSLHILHTIIKDHIEIFLSKDAIITSTNQEETRLIDAVRQYLCLSLSRNAASPLAPVFEISLEIFWLIISNLRSEFKREIPVFFDEIYFPVSEMKTSTAHQKRYLLSIVQRLCNDSRCIIEFYLNYDCDSGMPNICERLINYLTKLSLTRVEVTQIQKQNFVENSKKPLAVYNLSQISSLSISNLSSRPPDPDSSLPFPLDYALKITSINTTVAFLRSIFSWAQKGISSIPFLENDNLSSMSRKRSSTIGSNGAAVSPNASFFIDPSSKLELDDPSQFESLKLRKKIFLDGIKQFNLNPKKGVAKLIETEFIESSSPTDIGLFLLNTDGLDKSVIGEYLGEGDERNIAIMHAFVDGMEFTNTLFVDAMRRFLQAFRLPGESQKIDRYMLKFAERYVLGNPNVFANADTAYVLAYSVIMLNTDLHSPQIKNRMTFDGFLKNNTGIDDGKDLSPEFLHQIYQEIQVNEIKLQSEQHAALISGELNTQQNGFFGPKDTSREAYIQASKEMSTKTEKLVRTLGKRLKSDEGAHSIFYAASHIHHVKSIFDTLWMSILAGLTPPFKEYDEEETTSACLEGIKLSIRIACMFDLDYVRTSFISALVQFANLNNYEEIKSKNIDAIRVMLEIAISEGNNLKSAWKQILTSISQIERLQLIAQGADSDAIPDVSIAKISNRNSIDSARSTQTSRFFSSFSAYGSSSATPSQVAQKHFLNQRLTNEAANLLTATDLDVAMDRVFTNSAQLSGESIVEFVKALSEVSAEEIDSSGQSINPRMFSLQKVVDVCYYNMKRIRVQWSNLWAIIRETFNEVGCHSNSSIAFFALDSLRQLSMRFLEIEELSHYRFQKLFLDPFEYIITNNPSPEIKDMILECINNMILGKADKIKSGWKTIFGVLTVAAQDNSESLVFKSYKLANKINNDYFEVVFLQESFSDLVVCFRELTKNQKYQRISLLSLDILNKLIRKIAYMSFDTNGILSGDMKANKENLTKLWFPVLYGLHDIIKTGTDLEVRSRALNYMFDDLTEYGKHFETDFWDLVCKELLFPLFNVLSKHWEINHIDSNDDLSVWLSTTLIQALRNMIELFTTYFEALNRILEEYLQLLVSCICQENDTIARIGRSCLQDLLINNSTKFNAEHWDKISLAFFDLFDLTTAKELFQADPLNYANSPNSNRLSLNTEEDVSNVDELIGGPMSPRRMSPELRLKRSKDKSTIVVKCVLQLLMIETLSELFESDLFYENIPYEYLTRLANLLSSSYKFSRSFNDDLNLRVRLFNAGVMETVPTLLKQESSSSAVYIGIMFKIYCDEEKSNDAQKKTIIDTLLPMCNTIIERYVSLDANSKQRNIATWRPVVVEIIYGYCELEEIDFTDNCPVIYDLVMRLLDRSIAPELRIAIKKLLVRVGEVFVNERREE